MWWWWWWCFGGGGGGGGAQHNKALYAMHGGETMYCMPKTNKLYLNQTTTMYQYTAIREPYVTLLGRTGYLTKQVNHRFLNTNLLLWPTISVNMIIGVSVKNDLIIIKATNALNSNLLALS